MKTVEVVAAIIHHDGKILATQRGYGDFKDGWEFPGGKMEAGETAEHAIVREIEEELNVEIRPEKFLQTVEYDYPNFHLTMHCFISVITKRKKRTLKSWYGLMPTSVGKATVSAKGQGKRESLVFSSLGITFQRAC